MAGDAVELIAVQHQVALAVGGLVDGVAGDHHPAEMDAAVVARHLIVVAGHIDHLAAPARQAQQLRTTSLRAWGQYQPPFSFQPSTMSPTR